jgi:hypothetical protein
MDGYCRQEKGFPQGRGDVRCWYRSTPLCNHRSIIIAPLQRVVGGGCISTLGMVSWRSGPMTGLSHGAHASAALRILLRMHAFPSARFLPCHSSHTHLVVHPSGRFWCSRHTSLYRDSLNLVVRGMMVLYTPVKLVVLDDAHG